MKRLLALFACVLLLGLALTGCRTSATSNASSDTSTSSTSGDAKNALFPNGTDSTAVQTPAPPSKGAPIVTHRVLIKTVKGEMEAELYGKDAPKTVENFVKLVKKGFYNGLTFHRVETQPGFELIQGGDPAGNGSGGPGWSIKLEISPKLRHWEGALAMARSGDPDSAGSQFYICNCEISALDDQYAVFGKVTKNLAVSKKTEVGDKIISIKLK